ncbi:MAG: GTPase, partial [Candidatus Aminicenantes bacterium]|nr:GTPase [Candidatus Aminicenantes bacterium]
IIEVRENIRDHNPDAIVVDGASPIFVEDGDKIRGKKVLVIEDGPTLTHGEMKYGAGIMAAHKYGAAELVDPRPFAVGTIADTFEKYPEIGILLPAMGYGDQQMKDLEMTINKIEADLVIVATPIDLGRIVDFKKPTVRVSYDLEEIGTPTLTDILSNHPKLKR